MPGEGRSPIAAPVRDGRTVCQTISPRQRQTVSGPATPEIFMLVTNAIEAFNRQMQKIIKTRGQFPDDDALVKLLWLGSADIEDKRAAEPGLAGRDPAEERAQRCRAPDRGRGHRRLAEGAGRVRQALAGRILPHAL